MTELLPLRILYFSGFIYLSCLICPYSLYAQNKDNWHGIEREIHYKPEGTDFVKVNGTRKFNRALYGGNTAFRVEAGDLPEFALYLPGMGGNLKIGLISNGQSKWITGASAIKTIYRPGSMVYDVNDGILGTGTLSVSVLALSNTEGMIIKVEAKNINKAVTLVVAYGGATGKKFSRDGDIGADPESSFYLLPEYCKNNSFEINGTDFTLSFDKGKKISGVFPSAMKLRTADAASQESPISLIASPQQASAPVIAGAMELPVNGISYFLVENKNEKNIAYTTLPQLYKNAEAARKILAERVIVKTPDKYINTLGGALSMAADAIWEDPSYLHGAVAWRMRLPAWRGAYVADPLGWHDRARKHFSSYALSQVITPASGPVVADTALHLARQLEKMGTSMFSEGYIARNPGGDIRPHHYDMNLVFVDQLLNHFNWTGDTAYVREMWPLIIRHLAWEKRNYDADGDGLYDAYACIWASDALQYSGGGVTHSSAYNYRANKAAAELAEIIGKNGSMYAAEASKIRKAMLEKLWLKDRGWFAEYKDTYGSKQVHPAAGVWTVYHAIDSKVTDLFGDYQSLKYVDSNIPHIPVKAKGLDEKGLEIVSTSNWQPYTWSVNNVALAENLHTALAYWQGGRTETAFNLWKSALVESMYLSASPGGFEQLSFYDAIRGELYRDFADPVGMAGRSLVEGLFGILPDALRDTLLLKPGFPKAWNYASIDIPDVSMHFKRSGQTDKYEIRSSFRSKMNLQLQVPARGGDIVSLTVNGKPAKWDVIENIGVPIIKIFAGKKSISKIEIIWKGKASEFRDWSSANAGENRIRLITKLDVLKFYDPENVLDKISPDSRSFSFNDVPDLLNHNWFVLFKKGKMHWWEPMNSVLEEDRSDNDRMKMPGENASPVDISASFNDKVNNIFKEHYLSPRPSVPTLQLPVQGIGNWCYPLVKPVINDAGLRKLAGINNIIHVTKELSFSTPSDSSLNNIAFTSRWDVYPDSIVIPLNGHASGAWFMMTGTTNHMQSQVENGEIVVNYVDGTSSKLSLVNPDTWWPVEQDYYEDGYAFHLKQKPPLRVHFKNGSIISGADSSQHYASLKGFSNRMIDGGAATILYLRLDKGSALKSLTIRATANDVVIGLMSVSLLKENQARIIN